MITPVSSVDFGLKAMATTTTSAAANNNTAAAAAEAAATAANYTTRTSMAMECRFHRR